MRPTVTCNIGRKGGPSPATVTRHAIAESTACRRRCTSRLGWPMKARHGPPRVGTMKLGEPSRARRRWTNDAYDERVDVRFIQQDANGP